MTIAATVPLFLSLVAATAFGEQPGPRPVVAPAVAVDAQAIPVVPETPVPKACCVCIVPTYDMESHQGCMTEMNNPAYQCGSMLTLALTRNGRDGTPVTRTITDLLNEYANGQRAGVCSSTNVFHRDHSWCTSLPAMMTGIGAISAKTGTPVHLYSRGCGSMSSAAASLTELQKVCEKMPKDAPPISITGNQSIVTLDPANQVPMTFNLPADCEKILAIGKDDPTPILGIGKTFPCSKKAGSACFSPTTYGGKPNVGTGTAVTCTDDRGRPSQLSCCFDEIPKPTKGVYPTVGGKWVEGESCGDKGNMACDALQGQSCYVQIGYQFACVVSGRTTGTVTCEDTNGALRYCVTVGGKKRCGFP